MAPPFKRRCLSGSNYTEIDLHARRAQNDFRLKSIFESIFDKYGKDFNGIGDEIDMETGEIVVNNGHLLGMTNERDAGDGEYSCKELGGSNDDDDETVVEQSDIDVDSLMGDVPSESHLHHLGEEVRLVTSIPSDDEEDELASSEIERTPQRKDRLAAPGNCWLFNDKTAFTDKPALEAAWRAPPLPNRPFMEIEGKKIRMTSDNSMRDHSDDEQAGISLWTPDVKRRPRRIRESPNPINEESRSLNSGLHHSGLAARKQKQKWTQEEKERLFQLKTSTDLSYTAMESYFPGRNGSSIGSYWNYMAIRDGKANPKPHSSTTSECMIPLPSLSHGKTHASSDQPRLEQHHHSTFPTVRKPQLTEQQFEGPSQEMGSSVGSSSKPVEQVGHHDMISEFQISDDHRTLNGYARHESFLVSTDIGAHIGYKSFSSTRDSGVEIPMDELLDDANEHSDRMGDQHCHVIGREHNRSAKSPLYKDQEKNRRIKHADVPDVSTRRSSDYGPHTDGGRQTAEPIHQAISQDSYVDIEQSRSLSTSLEIEDGERLDLYCEGFDLSETQSRATVTMDAANPLQRPGTTECDLQQQKSISTIGGSIIQQYPSLAETTGRTELSPMINSAQPPGHGMETASHATEVEMTRTNLPERQIVQVVIPLAATSDAKTKAAGIRQTPLSPVSIRSPSAHMETANHAFTKEFPAAVENVPTALGPILPLHETLVIRTPTRSPSVAAAESQYAMSAAFVLSDGRPSLGPEIADSQPLNTTPAVATRFRAFGSEASNPIVLDIESQSSSVSPGAATPVRNQAGKPTKTMNRHLDSQPLRVTPGIDSARRTLVEEALESDIVESGSHPLGKTLVMTRSPVKKVKKQTSSDRFSSTWTAFNDDSEDELSYL